MTNSVGACVNPAELDPDDLIAYVAGAAEPEVADHLRRCAACRTEAAGYGELQSRLQSTFVGQACPPALTLAEYALALLDRQATQTVAAHLIECPSCRAEQRAAAAFLATPDQGPATGVVAGLRRLLARPLRPEFGLAGLRGAGNGESVTYDAEGVRLTISVQRAPRGGTFVIAGLLQDWQRWTGASVTLYSGSSLIAAQLVDDLGAFTFEQLQAGAYRLELRSGDLELIVDPLAAGSA